MYEKRTEVSLLCFFLVIFHSACSGVVSSATQSLKTAPRVGCLAPDFSLTASDGSLVRLSDFRGSPLFVNFWDVKCMYCRYEMPRIQKMHQTYADQGLVVLGVNKEDSASDVQVYMDRMKLTYPMLLDSDGKVSDDYLIQGLPYSYFIDKDGVIRAIYIGEMTSAKMEEQVQLVLR
jgi:cytochrome c biogenesis protein CcmG, thiol:disulfide interchange protein DsbE